MIPGPFKRIETDGEIDLRPIWAGRRSTVKGFGEVKDWIITLHGNRREIGRISLRLGEGETVYYFGHIGYHIDPPWRGHHYAQKACRMLQREIVLSGKSSVVITCDPDNLASRKTCERLGCEIERVVDVPQWIRETYEINDVKCRYIWRLN